MSLEFKNHANLPMVVHFSYLKNGRNHLRKALIDNNGNPTSSIGKETILRINSEKLPKEFNLVIEMEDWPTYDKKEAVKIVPGTGLGDAHHTELHFEKKNDKIIKIFKVHFKKTGNKFTDVDPQVIHPDKP